MLLDRITFFKGYYDISVCTNHLDRKSHPLGLIEFSLSIDCPSESAEHCQFDNRGHVPSSMTVCLQCPPNLQRAVTKMVLISASS